MIDLSYGGQFDVRDLVQFVQQSNRDYIIQGQTACVRYDHPKAQSLDYWLRQFGDNPNTKQADNDVISALVQTGFFSESGNLVCPDSGRSCKGVVLKVEHLTRL